MAKKAAKSKAKSKTKKATDSKRLKAQREQAVATMKREPGKRLVSKPEDHEVKRGLAAIPPAERKNYVEVMYAPPENEAEQVVVDGIPFKAYEPVALPVVRENMFQTLSQNPQFVVMRDGGKLSDEQKKQQKLWDQKRTHQANIAKLDRDHRDKMAKLRGPSEDPLPGASNRNPPRTS